MKTCTVSQAPRRRVALFLSIVCLGAAGQAVAQQVNLTAQARAGVAELGKQWNGEVNAATLALYAEVHRQVDSSGIQRIADLSYGPHELQGMDLFVPEQGFNEPGPVVIYFHGGGLVRGDKVSPGTDGLIYSNIAKFMARSGGIGINANYRLVPRGAVAVGRRGLTHVARMGQREHFGLWRRSE